MRIGKTISHSESIEYEKPRSIRTYSNGYDDRYSNGGLYAHFLSEDLSSQVMPLNSRYSSKNDTFKAFFDGDIEECKKFRNLLLDIPNNDDYHDVDFICDVINKIASHVTQDGSSYFEILSSLNIKPKQYRLHPIYGKNIYSLIFGLLQISKKNSREDIETENNRHIFVWWKIADVLLINFPKALFSKRQYLKILSQIKKYGDTPNSFLIPDANGKFLDIGFDFKVAQRNTVLFRNRLTRKIGFDFRNSDGEYITEFFMVHRYITFRIAKAILREHIVSELNSLAKRLGIHSKLIIEGLPSQEFLLGIQDKLTKSEISFASALDESRV